jgi:hypothetical protein
MAEPKLCPFCGGEAHILQDEDGAWHVGTYCGADKHPYHTAFVIADTKAEAAEAWNTRVDDRREAADYWRRMFEETVRERTCERTCRFIDDSDGEFPPKCSACGYEPSIYECSWLYGGGYEYEGNYCVNCGARVEGAGR